MDSRLGLFLALMQRAIACKLSRCNRLEVYQRKAIHVQCYLRVFRGEAFVRCNKRPCKV
jgi:hypothetical protein